MMSACWRAIRQIMRSATQDSDWSHKGDAHEAFEQRTERKPKAAKLNATFLDHVRDASIMNGRTREKQVGKQPYSDGTPCGAPG